MKMLAGLLLMLAGVFSVVVTAGARVSTGASVCGDAFGGALPGGVHTTRCLLPGMRIRVPNGWVNTHDNPIEFTLAPADTPSSDPTPIHFWIDPHASTPCTDRLVSGDLSTPTKIVAWLKHNRNVIVTGPRRTTIAGNLAALSVDLNVTRSAPRCDPLCPGPCIDYFLFKAPNFHSDVYGTGRGEFVRLWFAEIGPPKHLLIAGTDALTKARFNLLNGAMSRILATLHLPSKLPPRRGR